MLVLWDSLLTRYLHPEFHLFVIIACIVRHKGPIIEQEMEFDDILKVFSMSQTLTIQYCNSISGHMDAIECLELATALYFRYEQIADDDVKAEIFASE